MTYDEAAARLDAEDVTWAPYQLPRDLVDDPQAEAAGCFVDTPDGAGGSRRAPASPARFEGFDDTPRGPAPDLGQHTAQVLAELGYNEVAIAALTASGAVR
jgi:crotonobetainyl-CoA:carnitine CoA-transferase CaiB-like acyl-CoA transferase